MPELIESAKNPFGGVITKADSLNGDPDGFRAQLHRSMEEWRADDILVVWLEIPIANAALVPIAVDAGFSYHHAGEDYLLMTCALRDGSHIPPYASHYIGAGGIVLSESNDLLVVREKVGFRGRTPTLKLPGGALLAGEHLAEAVVREVLEETGVESQFVSLVCFRHWHGYRYGKSDIYFVCRLRPLTTEITMQTEEIQECLWMPVQEFLDTENVSGFNKWIVRAGMEQPGMVLTSVDGFLDADRREFFAHPDHGQNHGGSS